MKKRWKYEVTIIHHDDDIVVVEKPPTVLSVPDRFDERRRNVQDVLQAQFNTDMFVVHRLDADTSGVMLFAKHAEAHRALSIQFQEREIEKVYHAFVQGAPPYESGEIDVPISPVPNGKGRMQVAGGGKPSQTLYKVVKSWQNIYLFALKPITGRSHQIRVHCRYLGCPLLVDPLYGMSDAFYLSSIVKKYNKGAFESERPLVSRTTLHASEITFTHPGTGQRVTFTADFPKDLSALEYQLDKNLRSGS